MPDSFARLADGLAGRYTLEREIGRGGMASVYLARDLRHGRAVALKVLHPEISAAIGTDRFLREVRLAAQLQHPHILTVHDSGELAGTGGEPPLLWYTMPMVEGETLRSRLAREQQLPLPDAVRIGREVADALDCAHRQGIVHRDIKPDNVLLAGEHAYVADFGIAHVADDGGAHLTQTGTAIGTPAYMSPEQALGSGVVDARSDVYSLGVVLYEMIAGETPFGGNARQMVARMMTETPRPLTATRATVPPALERIVAAALASTPADRPSAGELRRRLDEIAAGLRDPTDPPPSRPATEPPSRAAGRRRWLVPALAAVAVVAAAGAALVGSQSGDGDATLDADLVAVAPFQLVGSSPALEVWSEGAVDLLARYLDGAGTLRAVAPTRAIRAWRGDASRGTAAEFGQRLGARYVAYGQIVPSGDSLRLAAFLLDAADSSLVAEREWRAAAGEMDRLVDSAATRFLAALNRPGAARSSVAGSIGTSDPRALRAFLSGMRDLRRASYVSALDHFRQSVAIDTGFVLGRMYAAQALGWTDEQNDSLHIQLRLDAAARNRGLSPRDSLLITGDSLLAEAARGRLPPYHQFVGLSRVMTALMDSWWDDPEVVYWVADRSYHENPHGHDERWSLAEFKRVARMDSLFAPAFEHLIELSAMFDPPAETRRWIAKMQDIPGLDPARDAGLRLASALLDPTLTPAMLDARLDSVSPEAAERALLYIGPSPDTVPLILARRSAERWPGARWARVELAQQETYRGRISRALEAWEPLGTHWMRVMLVRDLVVIGALPPASFDSVMSQVPDAGIFLSAAGVPVRVIAGDTARLDRLAQNVSAQIAAAPPGQAGFMRDASEFFADARRLAAGDSSVLSGMSLGNDAPLGFRAGGPFGVFPVELLLAAGREDEAWDLLQSRPGFYPLINSGLWRLQRARLAEKRGERDLALAEYGFMARLWAGADEPLRSLAEEAREAVVRLTAEPREVE